jgi:hypothetical protein
MGGGWEWRVEGTGAGLSVAAELYRFWENVISVLCGRFGEFDTEMRGAESRCLCGRVHKCAVCRRGRSIG